MATYPIKLLKDESGTPFVPLTSTAALKTKDGSSLEDEFNKKLEVTNIKAGKDITLTVSGNNITINNASKGVLIDNLTTTTAGQGALDARQGKILKDSIPEVVNNLTTVSTDKALSAYQGYLLSGKIVPAGGTEGQVLKKSSGTDWALEWGDAADPNAIIGDGSIKKIVYCTLEEYNNLKTIDPDTEYHIQETDEDLSYISRNDIQKMIAETILADKKKNYPVGKIEINVSGANPSTYLGFGTWTAWGTGRVPIGIDIGDTDFSTVEKTGGSKEQNALNNLYTHLYQGSSAIVSEQVTSGAQYTANRWSYITKDEGATYTTSTKAKISGSLSVVQPYITCYMWKRTA